MSEAVGLFTGVPKIEQQHLSAHKSVATHFFLTIKQLKKNTTDFQKQDFVINIKIFTKQKKKSQNNESNLIFDSLSKFNRSSFELNSSVRSQCGDLEASV